MCSSQSGEKAAGFSRSLAFRLYSLGENWFGVRLAHVGVIAGSAKTVAAKITFFSVHITDLRSAVGALGCGGSFAGIAVGVLDAPQQNDFTIARSGHSETLPNFLTSRADVLSSASVPPALEQHGVTS